MKEKRERVEECIYYTQSGRFVVGVYLNTVHKHGRFDTLSAARKFRDEIRAMRHSREERSGAPDFSADDTITRNGVREILRSAPRKTITRDGREYTLVSLPRGYNAND